MFIPPQHPAIRTMGRIDAAAPSRPIWVYPYTQARFRCTGTAIGITLVNHWNYGESHVGAIVDGMQSRIRIPVNDEPITLTVADHLPDIEHEVTIFKRQDGEHYIELLGFALDDGAQILPPADPEPVRRIEIYGDSVSCGERNEAVRYTGMADPETDLSPYSNAWYSYGAITARNLGAQLHDVAQGGAALLDGIGWFNGPDYIGMEDIWDRIEYNPALGETKPWDFSRYTPHVVIIALGQNDAHPDDFMASDYHGAQARHWRARYADFIRALRERYPAALIVCATTVLRHDEAWDRAIDEVCCGIGDPKVTHFTYSRNGSATPGHPRIAEHEEMARELTAYLEGFGDDLWN